MSLFLGKPNYARARPSTLLSNNEYYKTLYIENTDLELYFKTAVLGKKVERFMKSSQEYVQAEKSDILFYVVYAVAGFRLGSSTIDFQKFKEMDMESISMDEISRAAQIVSTLYRELGGNNKVAKSSELLELIQAQLNRHAVSAT